MEYIPENRQSSHSPNKTLSDYGGRDPNSFYARVSHHPRIVLLTTILAAVSFFTTVYIYNENVRLTNELTNAALSSSSNSTNNIERQDVSTLAQDTVVEYAAKWQNLTVPITPRNISYHLKYPSESMYAEFTPTQGVGEDFLRIRTRQRQVDQNDELVQGLEINVYFLGEELLASDESLLVEKTSINHIPVNKLSFANTDTRIVTRYHFLIPPTEVDTSKFTLPVAPEYVQISVHAAGNGAISLVEEAEQIINSFNFVEHKSDNMFMYRHPVYTISFKYPNSFAVIEEANGNRQFVTSFETSDNGSTGDFSLSITQSEDDTVPPYKETTLVETHNGIEWKHNIYNPEEEFCDAGMCGGIRPGFYRFQNGYEFSFAYDPETNLEPVIDQVLSTLEFTN